MSFFVGRWLRLGRALIARGFGGSGTTPPPGGYVSILMPVEIGDRVACPVRLTSSIRATVEIGQAIDAPVSLSSRILPRRAR